MRVIICGSRDWSDPRPIRTVIDSLALSDRNLTVVHGAARGADAIAGEIARSMGVREEPHPADWTGQGRAAGPLRNRLMLDLGADIVFAFKEDFDWSFARGGTENMVKIAHEAKIPAIVINA